MSSPGSSFLSCIRVVPVTQSITWSHYQRACVWFHSYHYFFLNFNYVALKCFIHVIFVKLHVQVAAYEISWHQKQPKLWCNRMLRARNKADAIIHYKRFHKPMQPMVAWCIYSSLHYQLLRYKQSWAWWINIAKPLIT